MPTTETTPAIHPVLQRMLDAMQWEEASAIERFQTLAKEAAKSAAEYAAKADTVTAERTASNVVGTNWADVAYRRLDAVNEELRQIGARQQALRQAGYKLAAAVPAEQVTLQDAVTRIVEELKAVRYQYWWTPALKKNEAILRELSGRINALAQSLAWLGMSAEQIDGLMAGKPSFAVRAEDVPLTQPEAVEPHDHGRR